MSEEKKQKLKEYQTNYCEANKSRKPWLNFKNAWLYPWQASNFVDLFSYLSMY